MDKVLSGNRVELFDKKGTLRILLDAGNGDGFSAISLFGESGQRVQISVQPDGSLGVELESGNRLTKAILSITKDDCAGVDLRNKQGHLGTLLGADVLASEAEDRKTHLLQVFKDGQPDLCLPSETEENR